MFLRTPEDGYLLDRNGKLAKTADGGKTWKILGVEFKKANVIENDFDFPAASVCFTDNIHGMVIAYFTGPERGWKVFYTDDGGKSWREKAIPGSLGAIYLTRNGQYLTQVSAVDNKLTLLKKE